MSAEAFVDNALRTEATAIRAAKEELQRIHNLFEQQISYIKTYGEKLIRDQVSGPPADVLAFAYNEAWIPINQLKKDLEDRIAEFEKKATDMLADYQKQVDSAARQAKETAAKADAAKKAAENIASKG